MTQLRSYTTICQSKKLAEILPLDSADMLHCIDFDGDWLFTVLKQYSGSFKYQTEITIPCWSLSALLDVINKDFYPNLFHDGEAWNLTVTHHDDNTIKYDTCGDDPLDIIYRMIVFLHDENLI